jgi:hypothetical protein
LSDGKNLIPLTCPNCGGSLRRISANILDCQFCYTEFVYKDGRLEPETGKELSAPEYDWVGSFFMYRQDYPPFNYMLGYENEHGGRVETEIDTRPLRNPGIIPIYAPAYFALDHTVSRDREVFKRTVIRAIYKLCPSASRVDVEQILKNMIAIIIGEKNVKR